MLEQALTTHLNTFTTREKVFLIEAEMRRHPQVECPVRHHFSQGVYARELFIPADTLLTGEIHKFQQLNILSQGEMLVLTGDEIIPVKAPFTVVSPPGTKRIAYAITNCVWTTIHGTDETDIDKIKAHYIARDEAEYLAFAGLKEIAA